LLLELDWHKYSVREEKEATVDWVTFLNVMVEDEKAAINKYRIAMEQADSEQLRDVFEKLMNEEAFHVDFLEQEIAKLQS
jgi:rubrerythrin